MSKKWLFIKFILSVVTICLCLLFFVQTVLHHANTSKSFVSPDGQYSVTIYVYSFPSVAMPGQGSDRDGYALVTDTAGRVLCKIDAPLAGQIQQTDVRWRGDRMSVLSTDGFEVCILK